jgi:hypothetical protein
LGDWLITGCKAGCGSNDKNPCLTASNTFDQFSSAYNLLFIQFILKLKTSSCCYRQFAEKEIHRSERADFTGNFSIRIRVVIFITQYTINQRARIEMPC